MKRNMRQTLEWIRDEILDGHLGERTELAGIVNACDFALKEAEDVQEVNIYSVDEAIQSMRRYATWLDEEQIEKDTYSRKEVADIVSMYANLIDNALDYTSMKKRIDDGQTKEKQD